jgi:hypothetical protein
MSDLDRHWILCRDYLKIAAISMTYFGSIGLFCAFMTHPHPWQYAWIIPALFVLLGWAIATLPWIQKCGIRDNKR